MSRYKLTFVVSALVAGAGRAGMAQAPANPPAAIVVTGSGEAQVVPDRATVSVALETRAKTAAAAAAENARQLRAVVDTLEAVGVAAAEISTSGFNVSPEMTTSPASSPARIVAYTVQNTVRVDIRRVDDVSRAIDAALANGANELSGLQFYSSKADSVRRVAISRAVESARADAEALAHAAGVRLGALIELSTNASLPRPFPAVPGRMMAERVATPIETGEQTVSATVSARWAIVQPH